MNPLDVQCNFCGSGAGVLCIWSESRIAEFHAQRIELAVFCEAVERGEQVGDKTPTPEEFRSEVNATGLV